MNRRNRSRITGLVLTCEHAGCRIPREHVALFVGARRVLASHRGWDAGALQLARLLAARLGTPLLASSWSRLLVDPNRSPTNPRIWSRYTKSLSRIEREQVLERYWWPHRRAVEAAVAGAIATKGAVVHVAVHTFTPALDGVVRNADVSFLYDSARDRESQFARHWKDALVRLRPELRVRYNYPYRGNTDGFTTWLRRIHPASRYLGFELEINQAIATRVRWKSVGEALATSLEQTLVGAGSKEAR